MEKRRTTVSRNKESQREGWEAMDEEAVQGMCEMKWKALSWLYQLCLQEERGTSNRYWGVNSKSTRNRNERVKVKRWLLWRARRWLEW